MAVAKIEYKKELYTFRDAYGVPRKAAKIVCDSWVGVKHRSQTIIGLPFIDVAIAQWAMERVRAKGDGLKFTLQERCLFG